jgi:Endodeoxyribonuclease RusA
MALFSFSQFLQQENDRERVVSFTVAGDPPIQQRAKIVWKKRPIPVYYNPSRNDKVEWSSELKKFLAANGCPTLPLFQDDEASSFCGYAITLVFVCKRRKADYSKPRKGHLPALLSNCHNYPVRKDLDNMIKFVMDAMNKVVYKDDSAIVQLDALKRFIPLGHEVGGPYSVITIKYLK